MATPKILYGADIRRALAEKAAKEAEAEALAAKEVEASQASTSTTKKTEKGA